MTKDIDTTKPLGQANLAEALGTRASTIKYYTQLGLLPYTVTEKGKNRLYDYKTCKQRLAEIEKLKGKGYKIIEIVKLWASEGKLADGVDLSLLNLTTIKKG